tara:strand:- start:423 stop:860 length:438 start_codon:yes stop_codon:yes gene_type:complete
MKKLLLLLFSTLLISCISVNLSIDDEAAKTIADAINKSNSKIHMMSHYKDGPISMKSDEKILIINDFEDFEWVGDDDKKMKKVVIRGERFGKGPNANRYMDELPKAIIDKVKRASEKGIDIKIDTIISEDGERKEIKVEVKVDNN